MKRLTYSANKFQSDKGTNCGYRYSHGFSEFYNDYFEKYFGKSPKILEIGVENGCSLRMYNDFFQGDCEIFGIDIDERCKNFETENTHVFIANQGNREELENFKKLIGDTKFDIIVDDGSHVSKDQFISIANLFDLLKEDGIYIIEDLHANYTENNGITEKPIVWCIFNNKNSYLTDEEYSNLISHIDYKVVYLKNNENHEFNDMAVTCIIKFKK